MSGKEKDSLEMIKRFDIQDIDKASKLYERIKQFNYDFEFISHLMKQSCGGNRNIEMYISIQPKQKKTNVVVTLEKIANGAYNE